MKKIYLSIAAALCLGSINAQTITEDQAAALNVVQPNIDLSVIPVQKGSNPVVNPAACDTMGTTWAAGNGQSGNMFDLVNTSSVAIQITGFSQCFGSVSTYTMEAYYKTGTFSGFEASAASWTMAGSATVAPSMSNTPVPVPITLSVSIPAGATYGFYFTNTSTAISVAYTNGNNQGSVYKQKNGLQFKEGRGISYPFGSAFGTSPSSRIWNGVINYCTPLVTGINGMTINESESSVYPNPMAGSAMVNISTSVGIENATAQIFDMSGRMVYSQENINNNNFMLNHHLGSGMYVLQVMNNNAVVFKKKIAVQ